jgi:benzoyl-CoA 2,3-dioxygenase component B
MLSLSSKPKAVAPQSASKMGGEIMSSVDTVNEAAGTIGSDRFVEISYDDLIPNNVGLSSDKQLQRALETWRPNYLDWWNDMGPEGYQQSEVYLRTAVGVDPSGWAKFGHVKMPAYRWGILLAPKVEGRTIPCGRHKGEPAWQDVPGEYRSLLRRLIVVQGDTEPASVEQQRYLGATAPSLYDMRNLFQVNVEEGRHLWAMVYLLVKYFGKDGREEAQALLERQSGQQDNPRILGAFNERTPDWLSFFMFTYFTDRDGKMQLAALAESGFDPLSRTCRFMLTEEAHHMFVGETGVQRTIEATCAAMVKAGIKDPNEVEAVRKLGVVDLPLLQRKANFHMSVTRDLFGSEISSNAAEAFSSGIKGRFNEANLKGDDHVLQDATYGVTRVVDGKLVEEQVPALRAINSRLLDDYIVDCQGGVDRWNKVIEKAGIAFKFVQPHKGFNRRIGEFAGHRISPAGEVLTEEQWQAQSGQWLPNDDDMAFIVSLMKPCHERGKYASWIAPPRVGINNQPGDFEYVRIY